MALPCPPVYAAPITYTTVPPAAWWWRWRFRVIRPCRPRSPTRAAPAAPCSSGTPGLYTSAHHHHNGQRSSYCDSLLSVASSRHRTTAGDTVIRFVTPCSSGTPGLVQHSTMFTSKTRCYRRSLSSWPNGIGAMIIRCRTVLLSQDRRAHSTAQRLGEVNQWKSAAVSTPDAEPSWLTARCTQSPATPRESSQSVAIAGRASPMGEGTSSVIL
jgi:hypothetical protein